MSEANNSSSSQSPSAGPNAIHKTHTHLHTSGRNFTVSGFNREWDRHGAGRGQHGPTRTYDPEGLMGNGGTDVDTELSHGGGDSATGGDYGSGVAAEQHQYMGSGSSYYLRDGQPRHTQPLRGQGRLQGRRGGQQGQAEVVWASDDADGCEVDITSGSDTEDSEATVNGDDPDGAIRGRHGPGDDGRAPEQQRSLRGDEVAPELHQSNLVGDDIVTEEQRRSLNGSTYTAPERRARLVGDLQITQERRRPGAAAAGLDEYGTGASPTSSSLSSDVNRSDVDYGVKPHSLCLTSDVNRSDVDHGVKPHSLCLSSDVNCSDSVDYSRIQRVMDMVRHHREDDDDVTLPSWGQLVQRVDGRRMSNSPSDGPVHPAETYDNRSSGNVYSQSQPVKHTRTRHDGDNYTDDPVDDVYTTGEDDGCRVERTQESGECRERRVQVNSGQKVNTTAFTPVDNSCDDGVVYERCQSSAFTQFTPRHESDISDGPNTHKVREYRNNDEEDGSRTVVNMESTRISHLIKVTFKLYCSNRVSVGHTHTVTAI